MRTYPTFIVVFVGSAALCSIAAAAESTTCTDSYEKAQENRAASHLKAALVELKACVAPDCPKFMRDDCARWMDQVESALPTVVFAARRAGEDLTDVEVSCDGAPLVKSLDGKAVPMDPGLHEFSFNTSGSPPAHRQMLIRQGERNRIIDIAFGVVHEEAPAPPPAAASVEVNVPAQPAPPSAIMRYLPYGLAGLGVLGGAGFALFGIEGNNQRKDLERTCSPYCESSQVSSVRTKYAVADTFLAVGIVSVGVATYLFLTRHGESAGSSDRGTSIGFAPRTSGGGGLVQVSSQF
jgi:hypothetical protein